MNVISISKRTAAKLSAFSALLELVAGDIQRTRGELCALATSAENMPENYARVILNDRSAIAAIERINAVRKRMKEAQTKAPDVIAELEVCIDEARMRKAA